MARIVKIGGDPRTQNAEIDREVAQATYDRLVRRYQGLSDEIIRAAWHRYLGSEPTEQITEGIRTGRRLRFE